MSDYRIIHADVLDGLRGLPSNSVHVCVTSPPYYGLRSYGTERWEGGAGDCDHKAPPKRTQAGFNERYFGVAYDSDKQGELTQVYKQVCGKCGARRIDQQIGLEQTPAEYIARLVEVFAEVRRVLRPDGTAWVNMGDSYGAGSRKTNSPQTVNGKMNVPGDHRNQGMNKQLLMMPARLAIALQDAGWWLRSDIIWCKRAPMPESVTDRPTSAHEHIFLLSKAANYYYDADAVREAASELSIERGKHRGGAVFTDKINNASDGHVKADFTRSDAHYWPSQRNLWNYWLLSPEPYPAAHFATFPTEIPRRAILAGSSERGCCAECGAPWRRVTASHIEYSQKTHTHPKYGNDGQFQNMAANRHRDGHLPGHTVTDSTTWQPTCSHNAPTVPCLVLDPFAGAGTTLLVASRLGRRSVGVELNGEYVEMAHKRIQSDPAAMNMRMDLTEQAV